MSRMAARDSVTDFTLARFALGIGESGNFPAGIKAVTEWFPAKERAFADRHLQRRRQYRRDRHAARRAGPGRRLWLAGGLHRHRRRRLRSGWSSGWPIYRRPPRAQEAVGGRARLYRAGSGRSRAKSRWLRLLRHARDLGLCARQVPDRPDLVVLPVLAARLLGQTEHDLNLMTFGPPLVAHLHASPTSAASPAAGCPRR